MRDSNYSRRFRNLNQIHQKKLTETKNSCDLQSLVCKTLIEYNQTFKTNYSSFVFRQNPKLLFIMEDYFQIGFIESNKQNLLEIIENSNLNEEFIINGLLIGRHHHICREPPEISPFSPFSPYSPFTPVDFTKIHSFNDKFYEYNQQEKNQNFLKGYLRKSVLETRKSLKNVEENKSRINRNLLHCKTLEIVEKPMKREPSIEKTAGLGLKLSLQQFCEVEDDNNTNELTSGFLSQHDICEKRGKNKKKLEEKKRNEDDNWEFEEVGGRIEARTSMLILQAKGVYKNINEETVDRYIKEIERSECINFTHEFFIERSKV